MGVDNFGCFRHQLLVGSVQGFALPSAIANFVSVANYYFARQFLAFGFPARMPRCAISSSFSSMSSLFLPDSWVRAASVLWSPSPFFLGNNS